MRPVKRVSVLGSTGSIGRQTLDVIRDCSDQFEAVALTAFKNTDALKRQAEEFGVKSIAVMDEGAGRRSGVPCGMRAIIDAATHPDADIVVIAVAGVIGLLPTLAAIEAGKSIALASKEVLVAAGEVVMPKIREKNIALTPIDSEHSAVFQCMQGIKEEDVKRIILTASGGPFRGKKTEDLREITQEQALQHPTWRMGGKITIDSATLMNKGLEVIEAKWLFNLEADQVDVVIHPQSIVHSMVETKDGSVISQMGWPNMRLPILYALAHPDRTPNNLPQWNPASTPVMTFEEPDVATFRCLPMAYEALKQGGTMPCVLNAANEVAANGFLEGRCGFLEIAEIVEKVMEKHRPAKVDLDSLLATDKWARATARSLMSV
jgi:1-deoxy-D-xylulose-5-phosphate reductoisomerase